MNDKEEMVEDRHYLLQTDPKTGKQHIVCKRTYHPKSKNPYTPWKNKELWEQAKALGWPDEKSFTEVCREMDRLEKEAKDKSWYQQQEERVKKEMQIPTL